MYEVQCTNYDLGFAGFFEHRTKSYLVNRSSEILRPVNNILADDLVNLRQDFIALKILQVIIEYLKVSTNGGTRL